MARVSTLQPTTRRLVLLLLLAGVALFFFDAVWMAPLRILVVVFHEGGHALAALATGGSVEGISLSVNEGGVTTTRGGFAFLVMNGGYLGSLITGVLLLLLTRRAGAGKGVSAALGLILLVSTFIWFRPVLSFGFLYGLAAGLGLLAFGRFAPPSLADLFVRFMGVFSALYALHDIIDDVFRHGVLSGPWYASAGGQTDAHQLADYTGIPSPVWGFGWLFIGLATLFALRKRL